MLHGNAWIELKALCRFMLFCFYKLLCVTKTEDFGVTF
jgi:hypothetical protein